MRWMRNDLATALALSVVLHLLVVGLVSFSWSSDPELQRPPRPPSFVQAVVMEKTPQPAAKPRPAPKPASKPAPPKPKPAPEVKPAQKPEPKPAPKPEPKPVPKPSPKPEASFSEPDLSELLAREEIDLQSTEQDIAPPDAQGDSSQDSEVDEQVTSYQQAIRQAITNRWLIPATAREKHDLVARVRVHLLPGGEVLDVALVSSSGDSAFDESVQSAIRSVGTLPVPSGELFHEHFRVMTFEFNPRMKSQ